jgi:hypothetical protein
MSPLGAALGIMDSGLLQNEARPKEKKAFISLAH